MKNKDLPYFIGAPILVVFALVLWNCDWSGKKTVGLVSEDKSTQVKRKRFSNLEAPTVSPLPGNEKFSPVNGPFMNLNFRDLRDRPLQFQDADIVAFSFLEGHRVAGIVDASLIFGTYVTDGPNVVISLAEGDISRTYGLVYNASEQALISSENEQRYDLKGSPIEQKRRRATMVVNDARIYEAAIDQWAIENNMVNSSTVQFSDVSDYIKASTELVRTRGKDVLGNTYQIGRVQDGVKVNQMTYYQLSDVTRPDFWGSYAPD